MTRTRYALIAVGALLLASCAAQGAESTEPIVTTAAGGGEQLVWRHPCPAVEASLYKPTAVAIGLDGVLYIASGNCVYELDAQGTVSNFAGMNEYIEYSGDGGPAVMANLGHVWGVTAAPDGSVYIADEGNNRIRKVDRNGVITTVAGDGWTNKVGFMGNGRYGGDGALATKASLNSPTSVAFAKDGTLYIADAYNHRVRRVDLDGVITTVAGNGQEAYSGDNGPATQASLRQPWCVAIAADGSLFILDHSDNRIRKVDPAGIITTVAGIGPLGYGGDGGPATGARFFRPAGLALSPDGSLFVSDSMNHRVRRIARTGIITTVVGDGWRETAMNKPPVGRYAGDGGPALKASLSVPQGLAFAPDGTLYIADSENGRIRKVTGVVPVKP